MRRFLALSIFVLGVIAVCLFNVSPVFRPAQAQGSMSCVTEPGGNGTAFGNVVSQSGVESYPLFIECSNGTGTTATLSTGFSGTNSGDFSITSTPPAWPIYYNTATPTSSAAYTACGSTLAAGTVCAYAVQIAPGATGSRSGTLTVSWTGPSGSPATFNFTATGVTGSSLNTVGCAGTLSSATYYYLTANLSCTTTAFTISGGPPDVNLNGFTLTWGTSGNNTPGTGTLYFGFEITTNTAGTSIENGEIAEGSCLNGSSASNLDGSADIMLYGGSFGNTGTAHDLYLHFCSDSAAAMEGDYLHNGSSTGGSFYNWYVDNKKVTAQHRSDDGMGMAVYEEWSPYTGTATFHDIIFNGGPQGALAWTATTLNAYNNIGAIGVPNSQPTGATSGTTWCNPPNPYNNQAGTSPANAGNECSNDQAFGFNLQGGTIQNNAVLALEGRGIDVGPQQGSNTITGNYVSVVEHTNNGEYYSTGSPHGCEIGGAFGMQFNQVNGSGESGSTVDVENNQVYATAQDCPAQGLSISNTSSLPVYTVKNNHFECDHTTGSTQDCDAVRDTSKEYTPYAPIVLQTNTLIGDSSDFYVDYTGGASVTFISDTFGSGPNPSSFHTFNFQNCQLNDPDYVIDPTFTGSATLGSYEFAGCGGAANYYGEFTYNVHVQNSSSAAVVGASVSAVDNQGGTSNAGVTPVAYSCTTNSSGNCSFVVNYIQYAGSTTGSVTTTNYSPVAFTITATNCTTKNYNETISATTNDTQTMTCSGGGGVSPAPSSLRVIVTEEIELFLNSALGGLL